MELTPILTQVIGLGVWGGINFGEGRGREGSVLGGLTPFEYMLF